MAAQLLPEAQGKRETEDLDAREVDVGTVGVGREREPVAFLQEAGAAGHAVVAPADAESEAEVGVVAQVLANAQAAAASATLAESWAVGGTGTREGEDTNNAEYWAQQAQSITNGQLGWFETELALEAAHPTGQNGQWAIIGSTDTIWTWDSDTSAWVNTGNTADLSNYYTKAQADAAFATAAQGALAASAVQSVNGKAGTAVTLNASDVGAAPAANGISTYTCTTSGTTHALAGTGSNIKFVADAEYKAGDTITVNGQSVTAQTQDGAALADGAWASGATVVCWLNGTTLTVNGGGNAYTPPAYNTDPVDTGEKWIDGKPIWRKVFSGTTQSSTGDAYFDIGDAIDFVVDYHVLYYPNTTGITVKNFLFGGTGELQISTGSCYSNFASSNRNTLQISILNQSYVNKPFTAIVYYTKV